MTILFPCQPFAASRVEPDFLEEFEAARAIGFKTLLYDHDLLGSDGPGSAIKFIEPIEPRGAPIILRGWMLPGEIYAAFHSALQDKGHKLLTTPEAYSEAHYLPFAYRHLAGECGRATWMEGDDSTKAWELYLHEFSEVDCVIKDWVKSAKAKWKEGCFIPRHTTAERFNEIFRVFRGERGKLFNRGVVFREFLPIVERGSDIRGLPLIEEVRLFFWRGSVLVPPINQSPSAMDERSRWEKIAKRFAGPFITIDVALLIDGTWRVVEVGDGAVSGLPLGVDATRFYGSLWNATQCDPDLR